MKTNEQIELTVFPRTTGKHHSRSLRVQEKVPAVIYGPTVGNTPLFTDALSIKKFGGRKYESTIFKLKSEDKKVNGQSVLLKSVQVHPVTRQPVHVDFYAVDMNKPIRVKIEIRLNGKPIGIADGGMLQAVLRELEIECLPAAIPEFVAADVSNLGVGDSLHVSDLQVDAGVKIITRADQTIATVTVLAEEVLTPTPAAATDAAAAPAAGAAAAPAAAAGDAKAAAAAPAAAKAGGDKAKK